MQEAFEPRTTKENEQQQVWKRSKLSHRPYRSNLWRGLPHIACRLD